MRRLAYLLLLVMTLVPASSWSPAISAQSGAPPAGEWRTYGANLRSTRYAPLDQITRDNFSKLEVAWRFKTDALGPRPEFNFESTPLMVGGVLYTTAGTRRAVVALDAATGEMLWMHSENEGKRGASAPRQLSGRGLAYWSDGRDARIVYVTPGYRLIALDAKTGTPVPGFGRQGVVDLKLDNDQAMDLETGEIGLHAAPVIAGDIIIVGAAHLPGSIPKSRTNEKGYVRGFDVRTGKRLWIFHTIPRPGEFGFDTWEGESASYTGNTGVWAQMSVDEELGLAYLPVELPTGDYFGGHRPGSGLFGESIVAVELKTGKRRWHYQLVHHGIWDFDIPCAPILADITVGGRQIKALAQPTKQGWVYVLDRVTGQPVWPIEERAVEQSTVPTEKTSPTQRFVTRPPAFDRQGVSLDDLIDFTPELKAEGVQLVSRYKIGPLFTPPVVSRWEGPRATLMLPSTGGGANWPGGSFDPDTNYLYVHSTTTVAELGLVESDGKRSDMLYVRGVAPNPNLPPPTPAPAGAGGGEAGPPPLAVQGLPIVKPPYGRITAIDLNRGEIVWQIAHGETPDNIRNHPALKGINIPRTGRPGRIGTLVTKTLVIAGEGGFFTTPSGQRGAMLRAYDKATGAEVGSVYMPAPQTGSPMTYMLNGRQYLVVAISGANYSGELLAFRAPQEAPTTSAQVAVRPTNDPPNPFTATDHWARLPEGRNWGSVTAVDVDRDGRSIWVAERCGADACAASTLAPVLKFDASGRLVTSFGAGLFVSPHGIHVDGDGNVWVTDYTPPPAAGEQRRTGKGHQVFKFSPDGRVLMTLGTAGVAGAGPDTFNRPSDIASARNGDIFVADGHGGDSNARIVKFSRDGRFIKAWGKQGTAPGEFNEPHSLAFDSQGRLFVADRSNNRIQMFDQEGTFLAEWKQFGRLSGIYIDRNDVLYGADSQSTPQLNAGWRRGIRIGSAADGTVRFFVPERGTNPDLPSPTPGEGIVADADGNLFLVENRRQGVVKFSRVPASAAIR